jgi:hypothetical protein
LRVAKEVLLAHADAAIHELAKRTLSTAGINLDVVADPAEAAALLHAKDYGLVVVDARHGDVLSAIAMLTRPRPMIIVAADDRGVPVDPQIASLIVPSPYDAHTLVGVMLACANEGGDETESD